MAQNILGTSLALCSTDPMTGFFRDGCCNTNGEDTGMHTLCAVMDAEFLVYTKAMGNDLSTPRPEFNFPGLKEGDRWCLCVGRWMEALESGCAPKVVLAACHVSVSEFVDLEVLEEYAVE